MLNPVSQTLRYRWSVATLSSDNSHADPLPELLHLLMYRDRDYVVRFMEINPVIADLLEQLALNEDNPRTGQSHLQQLAERMPGVEPGRILAFGQPLLEDFLERGVLIGVLQRES